MIGNAHIDPAWLWRWTEGYQEARATLASADALLAENDGYVFTFDQVALLEWIERSDPALFERVATWIRAGRLEVVGGWWVEPDCNLPTGEAYARQGLLAQRFLLARFGITATVGCNVDPFGHNVMLPQILTRQGMDSYCFLRPAPHESTLPATAFWWESPDGSRVLAYRIPHEYTSPGDGVAYHVEKAVNQLSADVGDAMVFYGVGNHGGGPTRANLRDIETLDERRSFGRMRLSTTRAYFDHIRATRDDLPVWGDELQLHAPGCYSANSRIKALNQQAENALLAAERYAVLARHLAGTAYPAQDLTHAWKQLLSTQFHDILPGTAVEAVFADTENQLGEVLAIADRASNLSVQTIARDIDVPPVGDAVSVLVFNPHAWVLRDSVEVETVIAGEQAHVATETGQVVISQPVQTAATIHTEGPHRTRHRLRFPVSVPPMGHRLYRITPGLPTGAATPAVQVSQRVLSNEHVRIEIDPATGWLGSLVDLGSGLDLLATAIGAHTVVSEDTSDTWGHRVRSYVEPGSPFEPVAIAVVERGPYRVAVRVRSRFNASTLTETFSLTADDAAVRVDVDLDWHERLRLFKLRVPTVIEEPTATFEVPYGHLVRPADSIERPGQSWVDLSGRIGGRPAGLAVITTAKYAYDVTGADIGITAARSPVYAWHHPRQLDPRATYTYQDQGRQQFTYLLLPHQGDWRAAGLGRRTAQLLMPPAVMAEHGHAGRLPPQLANIELDSDRVQVTAVKAAEDDDAGIVLRAVETAGVPGPVRIALPLLDTEVEIAFSPYEIKTLLLSPGAAGSPVDVDLIERPTGHDAAT